jgi:Flp pilus assembly protein TadD
MQALNAAQAEQASRAFRLLAERQAEPALKIARQVLAQAPKAPDAHHLVALCLGAFGNADAADAAFESALELAPGQPAILANRARLLRRNRRLPEALHVWRQLVQRADGDSEAWLELGLTALDLKRFGEATTALRRAAEIQPRAIRAWHGLGSALREQDELLDAETALRTALNLDPSSAPIWGSLAGVLRLAGRPAEAVEAYATATQVGTVGPEILDAQVGACIDALMIDQARALAEQLTRRYPEFVPGHTTLANLYWEHGVSKDVSGSPAEEFRAAAQSQPENHDLQLGLIGFLLESKQGDEAFERLQTLRRKFHDPRLIALQANAADIIGRSADASSLYAEADRALGPSDPSFANAYIRHLLKAGHWQAAADRAERALALDPERQETWAYLSTAWRLLGDPKEHWLCQYERLAELMPLDVPDGYADMPAFLVDLNATLEQWHCASKEPLTQSLRGGSQTPGRLFGRPDPRIAALQVILVQTIERWLAKLPADPQHPFLRRAKRSVRFTGSWSVKLWQSGSHANHFHNEGWMSSAFYVSLPPSVRDSAAEGMQPGCLQLGQPPVELGLDLEPRRVIRPRAGYLALFPSYLWHGTTPFDDDAARLTVAFDMLPKA